MLSEIQNIQEDNKETNPNVRMVVKTTEPQSTFDVNPTTTTEYKVYFRMDWESFPMPIIEVMLFKLEDNGEIAAQNLSTRLSDKHPIKMVL